MPMCRNCKLCKRSGLRLSVPAFSVWYLFASMARFIVALQRWQRQKGEIGRRKRRRRCFEEWCVFFNNWGVQLSSFLTVSGLIEWTWWFLRGLDLVLLWVPEFCSKDGLCWCLLPCTSCSFALFLATDLPCMFLCKHTATCKRAALLEFGSIELFWFQGSRCIALCILQSILKDHMQFCKHESFVLHGFWEDLGVYSALEVNLGSSDISFNAKFIHLLSFYKYWSMFWFKFLIEMW